MATAARRSEPGFTLIEVMFAFAVLATALLAFYVTLSRATLLSETNKQVKMALFEAQSIVEEIQGVPFDAIMDPDYPSPSAPAPRYRHLQDVEPARLYGTNPATGQPNPPRLENERVRVWYGTQLDVNDTNGNGDRTDVQPLPIVPGSSVYTNLAPDPDTGQPIEQNRPANNSAQGDEFITPDPLYVTVEVSWAGPSGKTPDGQGGWMRNMFQRITLVRSR